MPIATADAPTKTKLLDAAERLMLAKGYAATTLEEICGAAKLTKGSFFHYFDSKEALGKALLQRFCAEKAACARPSSLPSDPLARIEAYIDALAESATACGPGSSCLLGTFAQELSDTHPGIRALCAEAFSDWAKQLEDALRAAARQHKTRAPVDAKGLAHHFIAVVEGALILAKAKRDPRIVEQSLHHYKRYVRSVFGKG